MMLALLLVTLGLALLVVGGQLLINGASAMARRFGFSDMFIGLTVVAFGTSLPETAVNVAGSLRGQSDICFGNVIGSNIANIGVILALCAIMRPLAIHPGIVRREIPMMILAAAVTLVIAADGVFDRADGGVLLLLFCVFLYYTIGDVIAARKDDAFAQQAVETAPARGFSSFAAVGCVIAGLALLIVGGRLTIHNASTLAEAAGVPDVIVGLTLVAIGTSLPELVTSLIAATRGRSDLAVGNVVGSNIFNLFFIEGLSATLAPVPVPDGGWIDLVVMAGASLVLLPLAITHRGRIVRLEGALLLAGYLAYVVWRGAAAT